MNYRWDPATRAACSSSTGDCSIVFDYDLVLIYLDDPRTVVGKHLMVYLIDDTFILETRKIIYFFDLQRIDKITGFVDQSDLNIMGEMAPERRRSSLIVV